MNDTKFRGFAATHIERQLDSLLSSKKTTHATLREMVFMTTRALREGGDNICPDSAKIKVFRGHGFGLLPPTKDGKTLVLSNYLTSDLGSFRNLDWESQAQKLYPNQNIDLEAGLKAYASKGVACANSDDVGKTSIDQYDYKLLAERHSLYCANSVLISTTIEPKIARGYKAPVIEARLCPGRLLPTSYQPFGNELEYLVFGFILPEEIVAIHGKHQSINYRKGITDAAAKTKAKADDFAITLPKLTETDLEQCSVRKIGLQSSPEIGLYTQDKLNIFTDKITGLLEKQRMGVTIDWSEYKSNLSASCNCDSFVKDKKYNRGDWCE